MAAPEDTSTCVATLWSCNFTSTVAIDPALTMISFRSDFVKPFADTFNEYSPIGRTESL